MAKKNYFTVEKNGEFVEDYYTGEVAHFETLEDANGIIDQLCKNNSFSKEDFKITKQYF